MKTKRRLLIIALVLAILGYASIFVSFAIQPTAAHEGSTEFYLVESSRTVPQAGKTEAEVQDGATLIEDLTTAPTAQAAEKIMSTEEAPTEPQGTILPTIETNSATEAPTIPTATEVPTMPPAEPTMPPTSATEPAHEEVERCLVRGNCTDSRWEEIVSLWKMIPVELRSKFNDDGWTMLCTSDDFWTAEGMSKCAGLFDVGSKTCYISSDNNRLKVTVAHEFGHWVDFENGALSSTEEFVSLYEAEKDSFVGYVAVGDGHYTANSSEYFAQIFCQLLVAPDTASSAPGSFAFVERYLRG